MLPIARGGFCALIALISSLLPAPTVEACTRAVYHGLEDRYLTGRTFDWRAEITSNLWIFPPRHGAPWGGRASFGGMDLSLRQPDRFRVRHLDRGWHE